MTEKFMDLHLHTIYSDGTFSPLRVVQVTKDKGFSAISITDHDSADGIDEALEAGRTLGMEVVPGIELSAYDGDIEVHILGYYIDYSQEWFLKKLSDIRHVRKIRYEKMLIKLKEIGIDVIDKEFPGDEKCVAYGRPHVANLLLESGYVRNISEAFKKYIGNGCPAYVEKERLSVSQAVSIIKDARGVPILAHPGILKDESKLKSYLALGIPGIEVYHSDHTLSQQMKYFDFAKKHGLIITGGSDCHGDAKKEILTGKVRVPYEFLEDLKKEKSKML
jgi:predicted metal-dependent phosphoesterase TrpH